VEGDREGQPVQQAQWMVDNQVSFHCGHPRGMSIQGKPRRHSSWIQDRESRQNVAMRSEFTEDERAKMEQELKRFMREDKLKRKNFRRRKDEDSRNSGMQR
jgi:hypothetical protein